MLTILICATSQLNAQNGNAPLLLRQPAVSATDICFTFAGDIWLVERAGGVAHRLTAGPANESGCRFSPDGKWIAYTSTEAGNPDVYVLPTAGGAPKRLTWNPAPDIVRGWTPDGAVLFMSTRSGSLNAGTGMLRLYVQAVDAVAPTAVDLPSGADGVFSPDGKRLAYMPYQNANTIWKNYRGGRTTPIWIANLADAAIEKVPRENSTDQAPMWVGNEVFFISDRDGPNTLYSYDTQTKKVTRVVENTGLDIKSAAAGPGAIVYEQFGSIRLLDLKTRQSTPVNITLGGALTEALPRWVNVARNLQHPALSPTGVRAAFEARGEIITVPAKKGDARDVSHTVGATERFPAWSPDGQTLAYFSDAGGGYQLVLRGQNGTGEARTLKLGDDDTYYYDPRFSPDGKRIAYSTSRRELWYVDVASGKTTKVDTESLGSGFGDGGWPLSWSSDSRWITYGKSLSNRLTAAFVYNVEAGKVTQLTDAMSDVVTPTFDASGKYIYFLASTDAGPAIDFSMETYDHPVTRNLYAIVLRKNLPSPMAPESDEEKGSADTAKAAPKTPPKDADKPAPAAAKPPAPEVRIDFDNIDQRIVALPAPARGYVAAVTGKEGIVLLAEAPLVPVDLQGQSEPTVTLHKFDLKERKTELLLSDVSDFAISKDGEKLLYEQNNRWAIAAIGQPIKPGDGALATADIQVQTEPIAEWRQMYHEAFRLQRAFFYDPSYHGLDLAATEKFYTPYLDNLGSRADLDYLMGEAFGNLTVGHLYISSPNPMPPGGPRNGVLGADYSIENGRWRFAKVYAGENWNPQLRAPLTQPGVNVQQGDYLLAVNGNDLTEKDNVDHALEGTAGKQTVLRVGPNPSGEGARDVTVVPLGSEAMLRNLAWIDDNRRTVDKLSSGKLAYLYIPNTANEGYTRFNRYFFAQQDKQGAVVDERFNGGGNIADYMVNYLNRTAPFNYVTSRYGQDQPIPAGAIYGPKVMLINEYAGSGGDELPWLFRRYKVGQLVGKRTWGGLVGIGGYPSLMDGGMVTAPRVALWSAEGEYAVENKGVAPDVEVDIEPAAWRAGHDTQLEKAVGILMQQLQTQKASGPPARPKYPDFAKDNNKRLHN